MKTYILYIILLIGILFPSCSGFLDEDPKGSMNSETFFQSGDDLYLACHPMYEVWDDFFTSDDAGCFALGSDDLTTIFSSYENVRNFDIFNVSADNSLLEESWELAYKGIKRANFIISNYADTPDCSDDDRNNYAGQAYFHRAHWLFFLIKYWGPIPMPLSDDEDGEDMVQSSIADVYAQIIEDLTNAEEMLPIAQTKDDWVLDGYSIVPTQGAAKSLLAAVYLQMTGWPLKDTEKYALAAAKAYEVIQNESTYGYGLMPQDELWSGASLWNKEIVYGWPYTYPEGSYTMRCPKTSSPYEEGGWAGYMPEIDFFNNFPEGARKDVTFQTDIWLPISSTIAAYYSSLGYPTFQTDRSGDQWWIDVAWDNENTALQHPYYAKQRFAPDYNGGISWDDRYLTDDMWRSGRTQIWMRYAEVLLIYAEAACMANDGPTDEAYDAINRVRERAGLDDLSGLTASEFQEACYNERGWEFCGGEYCTRWADLLRFEKVTEANSNRDSRENTLNHTPDKSDYFMPIPSSEKNKNSNLTDNDGNDF